MAFCWRADVGWHGSFTTFQGIRTSIAKKPFISVIFQGGPDPLSTPFGTASYINHYYFDAYLIDNYMFCILNMFATCFSLEFKHLSEWQI